MGTGVERVLVLCLLEIQLSEFRGTECWGGETTVLLSFCFSPGGVGTRRNVQGNQGRGSSVAES